MIETIEAPAPVEPITKPKPSELLRLGRLLHPQVFGPLAKSDADGKICGTCAVGAILMASGVPFEEGRFPHPRVNLDADTVYGQMSAVRAKMPCEHEDGDYLTDAWAVTVHLNDFHRWPTEKIAKWLEGAGL